jgi:hypothetical protein
VIENRGVRGHKLAAPICVDAKSLGVIVVCRAPRAAPFTSDDARLLLPMSPSAR